MKGDRNIPSRARYMEERRPQRRVRHSETNEGSVDKCAPLVAIHYNCFSVEHVRGLSKR